jgi:type IV pilus assembly protein PilO
MAMVIDDIIDSLKNFDTDQLNDLNQVGSWPTAVKVIIWTLVFAGTMTAGYFLHVTNLQSDLQQVQKKEVKLRKSYKKKFFAAAHLDAYRKQQLQMEESFQTILRQLPGDTEIPGLIEDITLAGLKNGLSFTSIDLQTEKSHEFYVEKPIKIVVKGRYHDLGAFVSDVADLSRIVTLHDFSISPTRSTGPKDQGGKLKMEILARTYRYNDDRS